MRSGSRTNHLAGETSPYLLQHAGNPVDWHPWGAEALERARVEDKPIFLSIGYSACHWCHVMERESFEDETIARLLNEHFVSIKVDREERPDLDEVYMRAVQALTGSGGWPMSVFLTPQLEPFHGGTYFPPHGMYGRPGFADLLTGLAQAWRQDRAHLVERAGRLTRHVSAEERLHAEAEIDPGVLDRSLEALRGSFDPRWGGFGQAPKFPHATDLRLLLRHWRRTGAQDALEMATLSLERMAAGGIHDQIGGGFHRYSVDERWLIPHFEKMLYDNALLVPAYLEAALATGEARFGEVARVACEWVLREMTTPEGGFASSQDADSEGEEGRFYVWTPAQLEAVLGRKHGAWAAEWFGVTAEGNFEHGASALWRPDPDEEVARRLGVGLEELRSAMRAAAPQLLAVRERRERPPTDDKVLAAWNALMISALAQAHQVLGEPRFLAAARRAAEHLLGTLRRADGRLLATSRHGRAHLPAYLDDHAFALQALIDLYESDFDPRWLRAALDLEVVTAASFEDTERGGFYTTAHDHERLIARFKSPQDGALPSGNGVMALALVRLAQLTGKRALAERAARTIRAAGALVDAHPAAFSSLLLAVDWLAAAPREVVVSGELGAPRTQALLAAARGVFAPQRVVALADARADPALVPLVGGRAAGGHGERAFVCQDHACRAPLADAAALRELLLERG